MEFGDRIPQDRPEAAAESAEPTAEPSGESEPARIPLWRAFAEIFAVYVPAFGIGILNALLLLHNPALGDDSQVTGWVTALDEVLQYVMQASVVIFGVAFFCLQRGVTLSTLFGTLRRTVQEPVADYFQGFGYQGYGYGSGYPAYGYPQAYDGAAPQPAPPQPVPQPVPAVPAWGAGAPTPVSAPMPAPIPGPAPVPVQDPAQAQAQAQGQPSWPGYSYGLSTPRPPVERGPGWQFARAYFISLAGVLGFLISVVVYTEVTGVQTGAPNQGDSPWLVLVGLVVALAAGFGEEMLVTGLVTNALERAGLTGKNAWAIYLVAICLRIPFHLYYGWAALGVIIFTVVNIWVYRRWRLLWPIILAHATYDFFEYLGSITPAAGLLILALALATVVMLIVVVCIETSDGRARRRYARYTAAQAGTA